MNTLIQRQGNDREPAESVDTGPATLQALQSVNHVVAVGSVDGVLTAAAVLRNAGPNAKVEFCQESTVNSLDPSKWAPNSKVLFVNLAVDSVYPEKTANFVKSVLTAGHTIVGINDEHDGEAWKLALKVTGVDFDALAIKPVSGKSNGTESSGALLVNLLGSEADGHTAERCRAADAADRGRFEGVGYVVNMAFGSDRGDNSRRECLAYLLSQHSASEAEADSAVASWIKQYEEMLI